MEPENSKIILEIEKDNKLLREFGLATECLIILDHLLGEIILLADKKESQEKIINQITLGPKITKIKKFGRLVNIYSQLDILLIDRNKLAHGIKGGLNGVYSLSHHQNTYNLDYNYLKDVTKRCKSVFPVLYKEMLNLSRLNHLIYL